MPLAELGSILMQLTRRVNGDVRVVILHLPLIQFARRTCPASVPTRIVPPSEIIEQSLQGLSAARPAGFRLLLTLDPVDLPVLH